MSSGKDDLRARALDEYVVPELPILFRVALSLTHNHADAEDLVQETLIRAFRSIDRFDGEHPRAWLLTILKNANINRHRRRRPGLMADPYEVSRTLAARSDGSDDPQRIVVDERFDGSVASAFRSLPPKSREVVELIDIDGLSYKEAAAVLSVPVGTIMSRLHRARKRMKQQLTDEGWIPGGDR